MKSAIVFYLLLVFSSLAFAEEPLDGNAKHTITFERGIFSNTFTVDGKESSEEEVERLLLYVPEAKDQWSTGNILRYASWGISFAGGFCIGYGIMAGQADMEHGTFAEGRGVIIFGGAAAVIIGIIMEKVGNSKKDGAIELYNSESGKSTTAINIEVAPTPQGGIGLAFNF